jgi:hypothetical protein
VSSNDFGKIGASRFGAQDPLHHAGIRGSGGGAPQPGTLPPSLAAKIRKSQSAQKIYSAQPRSSSSVATTSRSFIEEPRSYVMLNSSPDALTLQSQRYIIVVPPRGEIIPEETPPHFQNISLFDEATGDYVPGSVVVHDIFETGEFGEQILSFDVVRAIKDLLGNDLVSGPYAKRGLSVMPLDASQEMIDALSREGHSRWEIYRIENAKYAIRAEQEKLDRHRKLGLPAPPPSPDVEEQALFLQEVATRQRARIADILNAEPPAAADDVTKIAGVRAGVLNDLAQPTLQTPIGASAPSAANREALLAALRSDPELRKLIVQTAVELEKKSAAAQAVINEATAAAEPGSHPPPEEEPPAPEEPPVKEPEPEEDEGIAYGSSSQPVTRVKGHPRRS